MNEESLIFIDETGFNTKTTQFYGYRERGVRLMTHPQTESFNHFVITATSRAALLGYKIYKDSNTAIEFGAFMLELLLYNNSILEHRRD